MSKLIDAFVRASDGFANFVHLIEQLDWRASA